jgi:hypothetical protein
VVWGGFCAAGAGVPGGGGGRAALPLDPGLARAGIALFRELPATATSRCVQESPEWPSLAAVAKSVAP